MVLEARERVVPEAVEPIAQLAEALGVDAIDARGAAGLVLDEARLLERFQMLRDRRPADRHAARNLADAARAFAQALEHGPARGVGEDGQRHFVSHDLL